MKKLLIIFLILCGMSLHAQSPISLNVRFGDSEIKGLLGAEFQISRYSLSAGWRPIGHPNGETLHSFCGAFTMYLDPRQDVSSWYLSLGGSSKGYLYSPIVHYPPVYDVENYVPEPSVSFMVGRRCNFAEILSLPKWNKVTIDTGIGWMASNHYNGFTFEFIATYMLFNNYKKFRCN